MTLFELAYFLLVKYLCVQSGYGALSLRNWKQMHAFGGIHFTNELSLLDGPFKIQ